MKTSILVDSLPAKDQVPFRAIHYLGSKLRMLEFIKNVADKEDPTHGAILDLFSGSGSVSQFFSASRRVVSVDIQQYSKVICRAILNPCSDDKVLAYGRHFRDSPIRGVLEDALHALISYESIILQENNREAEEKAANFIENCSLYAAFEKPPTTCSPGLAIALTEAINALTSVRGRQPLACVYFGGTYFSFRQTVHMDVILEEIRRAPISYRNTLMAALLSTASDLVNTVGKQFAQPIKPRKRNGEIKPNLLKQLRGDRMLDVFDVFDLWLKRYATLRQTIGGHEAYCMDYNEALDACLDDVNVVYADPPYTRDHYSRFYHGLETLCLQDYPELSKAKIGGSLRLTRGLYRAERHQSPFCIKSQAPKEFDSLFRKVSEKEKILMLSYSPYDKRAKAHPRVMALDDLTSLAKRYFESVNIHCPGVFVHSKLNHTERHLTASNLGELILVCRNGIC